jgi:2-methylcitrate dehydratase PrpD
MGAAPHSRNSTLPERSISEQLSRFAVTLDFDDLPESVAANAKLRLLDTLGACLASVGMPYADAMLDVVHEHGGREEARLFATARRVPASMAVLYNASLAHGNDYDDTHSASIVHPGSVIVPTALALAEKHGCSGKQLLAAMVAGYEVVARLGMVVPKGFHEQGFHPTGVCGVFAAAVVAGKLSGLSDAQVCHAMGIAGSQAAGSMAFLDDGAWTKRLHPGWAAHGGVIAAALAQRAFTGPRKILDGRYSLYALYAPAAVPDLGLATAALGEEWEILNTGFKPYPCGHISHPYMDCALRLRQQHAIAPEQIAAIELRVPAAVVPILCEPQADKRRPPNAYASRFSLPFSVALILACGHAHIEDFSEERIADPGILALCQRTTYAIDDSLPFPANFPGWVILRLKDGRTLETRMDCARGSRENPMSEREVFEKFEANAALALSRARAREIWERGQRLESIAHIGSLTDLLSA